jgi:hypothetical protein
MSGRDAPSLFFDGSPRLGIAATPFVDDEFRPKGPRRAGAIDGVQPIEQVEQLGALARPGLMRHCSLRAGRHYVWGV